MKCFEKRKKEIIYGNAKSFDNAFFFFWNGICHGTQAGCEIVKKYKKCVLITTFIHNTHISQFYGINITHLICLYVISYNLEGEQKKVEWLKTWPFVKTPQF